MVVHFRPSYSIWVVVSLGGFLWGVGVVVVVVKRFFGSGVQISEGRVRAPVLGVRLECPGWPFLFCPFEDVVHVRQDVIPSIVWEREIVVHLRGYHNQWVVFLMKLPFLVWT